MSAAGTIGNIREHKRFSPSAWRLICLPPPDLKQCTPADNIDVVSKCGQLMFTNYNDQLQTGTLVKCSDGKVRDIVIVLHKWLGDQEAIDVVCGMVKVSLSLNHICVQYTYCILCTVHTVHTFLCTDIQVQAHVSRVCVQYT